MKTEKERQIWQSFADKEYRHSFVIAHIETCLAFQIYRMRVARGWDKADLAKRLKVTEKTVSRWEDPDYGKYTMKTLKALAEVLDVGWLVRFASFSELIHDAVNLSRKRISPPSFDKEMNNQAPAR